MNIIRAAPARHTISDFTATEIGQLFDVLRSGIVVTYPCVAPIFRERLIAQTRMRYAELRDLYSGARAPCIPRSRRGLECSLSKPWHWGRPSGCRPASACPLFAWERAEQRTLHVWRGGCVKMAKRQRLRIHSSTQEPEARANLVRGVNWRGNRDSIPTGLASCYLAGNPGIGLGDACA